MSAPLWVPDATRVANARLTHFMKTQHAGDARIPKDYAGFHAWSLESSPSFWQAIWDQLGVVGEQGSAAILQHPQDMPGAI
ncbi:MAG: acetoacetate--CoA ligase, partial [Gammaproteobacteria bacterium]|nr:acetoacetate--CoA ligase [Gammaproteobacteria bacterium]